MLYASPYNMASGRESFVIVTNAYTYAELVRVATLAPLAFSELTRHFVKSTIELEVKVKGSDPPFVPCTRGFLQSLAWHNAPRVGALFLDPLSRHFRSSLLS